MTGPILMAPLLSPSLCSTSTWLGRRASLTHARYATTLTIISLNVPSHTSRLGVSLWSARFHADWLPIGSLLRGKDGRMIRSTRLRAVLTTRRMGRFWMFLLFYLIMLLLLILLRLRMLTLSWNRQLLIYLWLRMMVLLLRRRSLMTHSPNSRACSLTLGMTPFLMLCWAIQWKVP